MILITGATGLLGRSFVVQSVARGGQIIAVGLRSESPHPGLRYLQADLTHPGEAERLVLEYNPQWVVHCAAATNVDWCESHPDDALRLNAGVPRDLAVAVSTCNAHLVYISTDAVYGGDRGRYVETDECRPCNIYGWTKWEGEKAILKVLPESLIIRTNFFGFTRTQRSNLAQWILGELEANRRVPAFADVVFSPLFTDDLSETILDMMDFGLQGVFNVGAQAALSKYEFALKLARAFGLDSSLIDATSAESSALRAPRPRDTSLLSTKAEGRLGRPMKDVDSGIARFKKAVNTYRANERAWVTR